MSTSIDLYRDTENGESWKSIDELKAWYEHEYTSSDFESFEEFYDVAVDWHNGTIEHTRVLAGDGITYAYRRDDAEWEATNDINIALAMWVTGCELMYTKGRNWTRASISEY